MARVQENRVQIIITGDSAGAVRALNDIEQQSNRLRNTFKEIGKQIIGVAGGFALFEIGKRIISGFASAGLEMNAQLEQAAVQFKVLTGSAKEAQKIVSYLYNYAVKTPFEFQGILQAASVVKGAKLDMEKWIPVIGDMAAAGQAAGLTMDQVAMAIARVRAGNVGEFFERVGAYLGITREDLRKYGIQWEQSGALADRSAAGIERLIEALYQEATRRFKGMAEEQSNTWRGMWSTIKDTFGMIQAEVMKPFFEYLRDNIMPAIRELSGRFLDAYRAGGLFAGLKEIIPPKWVTLAEKVAEAWDTVSEAGRRLWEAVKPFATEVGRLAAATLGGLISVSADLARALADLISKFLEIPGAALAIQGLVGAFILFKRIIPLMTALGKSILGLSIVNSVGQWVVKAVQLMQIQWILGAKAGASFVSKLIAVFTRLGTFILGSINWWAVLAAAAIAAVILIKRNWETVGPFFSAIGRLIVATAIWLKDAVVAKFEEMRLGAVIATRGLVAGVSSLFAMLLEKIILPLGSKILPETWLDPLRRVSVAAKEFSEGQIAAVKEAAGRYEQAKDKMAQSAKNLGRAWEEVKRTGKTAWDAVKTDVINMARAVTDRLKGVGEQAGDTGDELSNLGEDANEAAGGVGNLEDALKKLQSAAASAANAVAAVFSEIPRAVGAGTRATLSLTKQIQLAMLEVENYITAGGQRSGEAILRELQSALNMLPWAVQEIGPRVNDLLQRITRAAAMLMQLPMEEARKQGLELASAMNMAWAELQEKVRDYAYNSMQYLVNIGAMTVQQQASHLRKLIDTYRWSTEERWRLEQELYRKNIDILNEQVEAVKKSYEQRLAIIDEEVNAEVKRLEERLKALDETDELAKREKDRQEHEKKIADLMKQRRYHELRTGIEHQRAIMEIDEQIAEETRRFEEQQRQWSIDDQREQIRKEIDLAKERGEERKKILQKEFEDTLKLYDGQFKELSARLAIWEPEYLDKFAEIGRKAIEALAAGQMDSLPALEAVKREIESRIPGMETEAAKITPAPAMPKVPDTRVLLRQDYELINGLAAMAARQLAGFLNLPEPVWKDGKVYIGGKVFTPLALRNGTAMLSVRQVGEAFGWKVDWDNISGAVRLQKAHKGARVLESGIAELEKGELVFPAGLSAKLERLIAILQKGSSAAFGKQLNLYGPLLNIEKQVLADEVDAEIVFRELRRQIATVF